MSLPLLLLLGGGAYLLAANKRARSGPARRDELKREAERIVRESREIIHGERDSYSEP